MPDKIPVKFILYKKETIGYLTPVTGIPNTWWLHDKENSYLCGTLTKTGNKFKFVSSQGLQDEKLAEQFGKSVSGV